MVAEKVTRRTWTALLAGASMRLNAGQTQPSNVTLRQAVEAVSQVKLPRATPPAFRFDPR